MLILDEMSANGKIQIFSGVARSKKMTAIRQSKKPALTAAAKARISDPWFVWLCSRVDEAMQNLKGKLPAQFFCPPTKSLKADREIDRAKPWLRRSNIASAPCFARISQSGDQDLQRNMEDLTDEAQKAGQEMRIPVPQADVPLVGEVRSLALKQLLCGAIAGGVASTTLTPFEIVRTRTMAGRGGESAAEVLRNVIKHEGLQSIMKGSLLISICLNSLNRGIQFFAYEAVKRRMEDRVGRDPKLFPPLTRKLPISTVGGASAGLASMLCTYPLKTVSDRMTLQPSEYKSMAGALLKVLQKEGFTELFRGITPAILSAVPTAAASFYTFDTLKKKYLEKSDKKDLEAWVSLLIGAVAGGVSSALTYPLEAVRKQISMSALPRGSVGVGRPIDYSNTWQALIGIVEKEGFRGLYRGVSLQVLEMVPFTALSFMTYEFAKRALIAQGEERRDEAKDDPSS